MKRQVQNVSFNAASRTVTLVDIPTVDIARVLLIANVTDNLLIYSLGDPNSRISGVGSVLTLTFDTTGMSDTDEILVIYDYDEGLSVSDNPLLLELQKKADRGEEQLFTINAILQMLLSAIASPAWWDPSANQLRAQITGSLSTITTLTTCASVTNMVNLNSYPADQLVRDQNMSAWAANIGSKLG